MRYQTTLEFEASNEASKDEIRAFIKEWLECGGGCRPPSDPLFHSLGKVKIGTIKEKRA